MGERMTRGNEDIIMHDDRWPYPWWFFSTARFNPGGPAWYGNDMRTPATIYMEKRTIEILATWVGLLLMFVLILPTIKYRLQSTITALNALGIGVTISMCMVTPEWVSGSSIIESTLNHFSQKIYGMDVGVHIGLSSFNVTLQHLFDTEIPNNHSFEIIGSGSHISAGQFWYNEKVVTFHAEDLEHVMQNSLRRGMPTPILTVIHFLTSSTMGFEWPHRVGEAGFHCYIVLLFALLAWVTAVVLIAFIPRYSSYAFIAVGGLMFSATTIYFYWAMIDTVGPVIVVEDQFLILRYGGCFWACLAVGVWSIMYGFTLAVFDLTHPESFLTIFDVDYDHKRALARAHRLNTKSVQDEIDHMGTYMD